MEFEKPGLNLENFIGAAEIWQSICEDRCAAERQKEGICENQRSINRALLTKFGRPSHRQKRRVV
jgi:hypothetical protein